VFIFVKIDLKSEWIEKNIRKINAQVQRGGKKTISSLIVYLE
jgi:hypothetical protein